MKKLTITMCSLSVLFLVACSDDTGLSNSDNSTENSSITSTATGQAPSRTFTAAGQAPSRETATTERPESKSASGSSYTGFDMAGIYLGMSPEEVEAVIKDYAPDMAIKKDLISFNYDALGARYKTDSFINYMGGSTYGGKLSLGVRLSSPPGPLKVVGVSKGDRHEDSPIAQSVYVESLINKYGSPARDTGTIGTGQQAERTLEWPIGNGTVQCFSKGREASTDPVLGRMVRDGHRYPDPTPEFAQHCISMLRYVLRGEPVIRASGTMVDVVASANAEFKTQAWIQSLIDEKSSPGTEKPRL